MWLCWCVCEQLKFYFCGVRLFVWSSLWYCDEEIKKQIQKNEIVCRLDIWLRCKERFDSLFLLLPKICTFKRLAIFSADILYDGWWICGCRPIIYNVRQDFRFFFVKAKHVHPHGRNGKFWFFHGFNQIKMY
jgi:hypothetical protein